MVPSAKDIVLITNAGTYDVTLNVDPTLSELVVGGESGTQRLNTAWRTVTLNGRAQVGPGGELQLSGETVYSRISLSLMTVESPDPAGVLLQIGKEGDDALVSWPLEFGGGTLYACTNINQPDWVVVPTEANSFLDYPMLPHRWYRLKLP